MALEFTCPRCQSKIVSKYLKIGEEAACRNCGTRLNIPESARVTTDDAITTPTSYVHSHTEMVVIRDKILVPGKFAGVRAWDPKWFHALGLLLSFIPASVLWALNYGRFGDRERMRSSLLTALLGSVAFLTLAILLPKVPGYLALFINIGAATAMYNLQADKFKDFIAQGGEKASYKYPWLIGTIIVVPIIAANIWLRAERQMDLAERREALEYNKWLQLRESNQDAEALRFAKAMYAEKPEERRPSIALALSYLALDQVDSAIATLKPYVDDNADDLEATAYLELALTYAESRSGNFTGAIEHLDRSVSLKPDWKPNLDSLRAQLVLEIGSTEVTRNSIWRSTSTDTACGRTTPDTASR